MQKTLNYVSTFYEDPDIFIASNDKDYIKISELLRNSYVCIKHDNEIMFYYVIDMKFNEDSRNICILCEGFDKTIIDNKISFKWHCNICINYNINDLMKNIDDEIKIISKEEYNNIMMSYLDEARKILIDPLP